MTARKREAHLGADLEEEDAEVRVALLRGEEVGVAGAEDRGGEHGAAEGQVEAGGGEAQEGEEGRVRRRNGGWVDGRLPLGGEGTGSTGGGHFEMRRRTRMLQRRRVVMHVFVM